ncbi:signal transducer and activator of transcription 2 isoform X2 [Pseudonaja textilis]|uniref:signal transducer and activator of transcription 2 isoform X2 n=1 Tax=Pseudonaja textilis TaxID=8673 RepID=UPI000EA9F713|nr:signal transducer and activator of transcription 2 isoform X2 [Pseudonaja textilis]
MSQWQRIQMLDKVHMDQIDLLYSEDTLPMEVRQYLAYWIEEQNWNQAIELGPSQANCLFYTMLSSLDDQIGRLALGEENNANMLLKHNLRRSKLHLWNKYQEHPQELAIAIEALLRQEKAILSEAFSASQASVDSPCDSPVPTSHQHKIEERLMELQRTVQSLKCSIEQHDDLQDNFDFSFRTHDYLEKNCPASIPVRNKTIQNLQSMLNKLNHFRQEMLSQIHELLGRSATLRDLLLEEVAQWQVRQRLVCIGEKCDTSLGRLEEWFTKNAEILFQLLHLLMMLKGMYEKVTYQTDPLKSQLPLLVKRLQEQIICLLKSAFVVDVQPKMQVPNKRPLVLRTSHKFSVRARLLVKLLDRNKSPEAKIDIDRDATNLTGFRRFNILTSSTKTLMIHDPQKQGLVCDFKYITLKEQKISGTGKGNKGISEGSLPVTEELHIITFTLDYCYQGIECQLQTSTLPVVIVSNANQISSAWASILWFIMLSKDTKDQLFFSKPPAATWAQLSVVLSWQFSAATERGLDKHQLKMLGEKLCGPGVNSQSTITWDQFSKGATAGSPEDNSFSFWTWIDGILLLIQEQLLQLWKKLIMGFVSRKYEKHLLKKKRAGTFLIRFSESTSSGGITFTWVDFNSDGSPQFNSVEPYTKKELEFLSLPDIIRDYQLFATEAVPENPLLYLYPDTPRDEAFGSYYEECQKASRTEQREYLNRRLIRVSTQPGETQMSGVNEPLAISKELVADEPQNPEHTMKNFLLDKEDPFLFQSNEEQQKPSSPFDIPQLQVDDPEFQCLLNLEDISNDTPRNDIDDLLILYSKVEV